MGTRLLFYIILYPFSWLPLKALYAISYLFYLIIAKVVEYRKAVINQNLRNSFPEKSEDEIDEIRDRFYKYLSEIAAEMIKMLSISRKQLVRRYRCVNPEIVDNYYDDGKSVILMSSHYNNWEWMVLGLDMFFKHYGVGVGAPNSNKVFEKLINRARTRYGTEVIFANKIREAFSCRKQNDIHTSYMMLSDQSPGNPEKSFKARFLNQPTAVIYGAEHFALKYNLPVIYYEVIKIKRGYYELHFTLIIEKPISTSYGEITTEYLRLLEKTIQKQPEYWLWSHKRWKHKIQINNYERSLYESNH
ncbi:MAG: lysophospholipid acyltransferase family protein [Bacteroidales bacterium]|jgi:KDO2-lipid IV(A) lauroyltransferase|nr:lysophospholipid acyltransferase family protein [Bacteroidales bacterium]